MPDWPAPARVHACATTRKGGASHTPYDSLNLGMGVGDDPADVAANRAALGRALALPQAPCWLRQVHGTHVVESRHAAAAPEADACIARTGAPACAVLTADCVPILLCNRAGTRVAAAHAGWRGLAAGIAEAAIEAFNMAPEQLLAWLGPGIGAHAFEVGEEVRVAFLGSDPDAARAFTPSGNRRWFADLYALARRRLNAAGVSSVFGGGWCTYGESERFFSYRREGVTGRMAALIWIA